jgi:heme/copper-type cytochrome/quinol oxidase subunit 1
MNTIVGALIAALIGFGNALLALFMNDPELTFAQINQAAWVGLLVGAIVQFLKDYQAISTRRLVNKVTSSGDGGGTI